MVEDVVLVVAACDALAVKENIFVEAGVIGVALGVGFVERVAAHAVPIQLAIGFLDALAVAVVRVAQASGGSKLIFRVVSVLIGARSGTSSGCQDRVNQVSGSVIAMIGDLASDRVGENAIGSADADVQR